MKSSQHVHSFLSSVRGNGEIDELAIIQYCAGFGIKAEFFNTEKEPLKITLNNLKAWFSCDFPQKNDVITLNDTGVVGIVEKVGYNSFYRCVIKPFRRNGYYLYGVHRTS